MPLDDSYAYKPPRRSLRTFCGQVLVPRLGGGEHRGARQSGLSRASQGPAPLFFTKCSGPLTIAGDTMPKLVPLLVDERSIVNSVATALAWSRSDGTQPGRWRPFDGGLL